MVRAFRVSIRLHARATDSQGPWKTLGRRRAHMGTLGSWAASGAPSRTWLAGRHMPSMLVLESPHDNSTQVKVFGKHRQQRTDAITVEGRDGSSRLLAEHDRPVHRWVPGHRPAASSITYWMLCDIQDCDRQCLIYLSIISQRRETSSETPLRFGRGPQLCPYSTCVNVLFTLIVLAVDELG